MDPSHPSENFQFICLKQNHNLPIVMVILDENIQPLERLCCLQCFNDRQIVTNKMISISQAVNMVEERLNILNQKKQLIKNKLLQDLIELQEKLTILRTSVINNFNENLRLLGTWINELSKENKAIDQNQLIYNLEILVKKNLDNDQDQLEKNTQSYFKKLELAFQKLLILDDYLTCNDLLEKIQAKLEPKQQIQLILNQAPISQIRPQQIRQQQIVVKGKQVSATKQSEQATAIAFNSQGSIMVAGCNSLIKVWKFEKEKLSEIKQLKGHSDNVYCLVFSKKHNWFASGGRDSAIRSWKQYPNEDWRGSEPQKIHSSYIMCLIMNQYEDQLISCSMDKTICVWNINCQTNTIQFDYTLGIKHQGQIYCISMNESETALVSCGKDKQIILWVRGENQRWIYKSQITNNDYGQRICFISETEIIWQQFGKGISHFFENVNGYLQKKQETITFNQQQDGECLFPTIFNKEKEIIIQKHSQFVYIISKQANGKYTNITFQIDQKSSCHYGALTMNGDYLVIWSFDAYEFKVFKLTYQ